MWSNRDKLLIATADELVKGNTVKPTTMQQLAGSFSSKEVIEIIFIANHYQGLSKLANSLGIELESNDAEQ